MKPAKKAYLYLLLAAIIWGVAGPVIKIGLDDLSYDVFLTGRFLISALIAIPFLLNFKKYVNKIDGAQYRSKDNSCPKRVVDKTSDK